MGTTHPLAAVALARALVGPRGARSRAEQRDGARPVPYGAYLAEHYLPGLDEGRVELLGRRLRGAAARRGGDAVRLLASARGSRGRRVADDLLGVVAPTSWRRR